MVQVQPVSAIQPAPVHACFDYIFGACLFDIQHLIARTRTHTYILVRTHSDTFTMKLFFDGICFSVYAF